MFVQLGMTKYLPWWGSEFDNLAADSGLVASFASRAVLSARPQE